jgi:hypothetical protein
MSAEMTMLRMHHCRNLTRSGDLIPERVLAIMYRTCLSCGKDSRLHPDSLTSQPVYHNRMESLGHWAVRYPGSDISAQGLCILGLSTTNSISNSR